jgi:hypothetical protein
MRSDEAKRAFRNYEDTSVRQLRDIASMKPNDIRRHGPNSPASRKGFTLRRVIQLHTFFQKVLERTLT